MLVSDLLDVWRCVQSFYTHAWTVEHYSAALLVATAWRTKQNCSGCKGVPVPITYQATVLLDCQHTSERMCCISKYTQFVSMYIWWTVIFDEQSLCSTFIKCLRQPCSAYSFCSKQCCCTGLSICQINIPELTCSDAAYTLYSTHLQQRCLPKPIINPAITILLWLLQHHLSTHTMNRWQQANIHI